MSARLQGNLIRGAAIGSLAGAAMGANLEPLTTAIGFPCAPLLDATQGGRRVS